MKSLVSKLYCKVILFGLGEYLREYCNIDDEILCLGCLGR